MFTLTARHFVELFLMSVQDQSSISIGQGSLEDYLAPKLFVRMACSAQEGHSVSDVRTRVHARLSLRYPLSSEVLVDKGRVAVNAEMWKC